MKKINSILVIVLLSSIISNAQNKSGFYMSWNIDHTERSVRPSIKISDQEAKTVSCYYVEFDDHQQLKRVKFYFNGKESNYGSYGAHELERSYFNGYFIEKYKSENEKYVSVDGGVDERRFVLNPQGYWVIKENTLKGKLIKRGVAKILVSRNYKGEIETEIQLSADNDTIPDGNGFKIVHFSYDKKGLTRYRQNRNKDGNIVNGTTGYATVIFQFNQDGMFFEEQFLDEKGELFLHPQFDLAKINWREFNKYGKPSRIYYMDAMGFPHEQRALGKIIYRPNMTRESITYFNRIGQKTADVNGISKSVYNYSKDGKYLGRTNYDINGEEIE